MSRVITFSTKFPATHVRAGEPTHFVEKIMAGLADGSDNTWQMEKDFVQYDWYEYYNCSAPKLHTIRAGNRWRVGDKFSPRIWSGKPYASKQLVFSVDLEIKKIWDFQITTENDDGESDWSYVNFLGKIYTCYGYGGYDDGTMLRIAKNYGLSIEDFYNWFLTGRTKQQRLGNEPKIFTGQIICWDDRVSY